MKLFLDTTVLLAACGSSQGSSHAIIFEYASWNKWKLISSPYCFAEVQKNLTKLPQKTWPQWQKIQPLLISAPDVVTLNKPSLLSAGKDKPILYSAIACKADALLTLDTTDFKILLNTTVYGVEVQTPGQFLLNQRKLKILVEPEEE